MADPVPQLVEPAWLESHLTAPDLRVLDCTVHLSFHPETGARQSRPGRADWAAGHVPGSGFADLLGDLSETEDADYPFQALPPRRFADAMEALGVGDDSRVVLYDASGNRWAARVWWLLRSIGFDRAGVLNGGWERWTREDRPVATDADEPDPASLSVDPRPACFADAATVSESIDRDDRCLINALRPADHAGETVVKYGRPGHIPTSVNVPAVGDGGVLDPDTGTYLPRDELRRRFDRAGALEADRVITYCGGGIAASSVAFALTRLGVEDVAVYDGSLSEWGADPDRPMATGGGA